jgi:2-oxoglutarate ferredoxin oxidoreductase subunit delta
MRRVLVHTFKITQAGKNMVKTGITKTKPETQESIGAGDARKPDKPKKRFQPFIIRAWCKNCGICAAFCPKHVLHCDDSGAHAARPDECIGCRFCEMHCPDLAIAVKEREAAPGVKTS